MRYEKVLMLIAILVTAGCMHPPPQQTDNVCQMFQQFPSWYWETQHVERRWHVPIHVQMAVLDQESKFLANAKPPPQWILGVIPWSSRGAAYGYSQALQSTWEQYRWQEGGIFAARDGFASSVDFVGWYINQANQRLGIARDDTYNLYLAYHEGLGGYARRTYQTKAWLRDVAQKVARRGLFYQGQLKQCQRNLPREPWYRFW